MSNVVISAVNFGVALLFGPMHVRVVNELPKPIAASESFSTYGPS